MTTVHEFSEEFHISLAKVRKIKKRYPQLFNETDSVCDIIRATVANGDRLTAMQLLELIENPSYLLELGKYAGQAQLALAALGDPKGQVAPNEVAANIMEAAKGEAEAVQILVDWLRSVIPT